MRPFAYRRAGTAADAARGATLRSAYLAGGTTLLDLMKLDVMQPSVVIDINGLAEHDIRVGPEGLHLGALTHMAEAARHPAIRVNYPLVSDTLALAASAQLRNMATLGGNVLQRTRCTYFRDIAWAECNKRSPGSGCAALHGVNRKHAILGTSAACIASYPGDFAQALIALDASVDITSVSGRRSIPFAELHRDPGDTPDIETTLQPGDLITGFFIQSGPWTKRSLYVKVRDRESYEFALASAAVALDLDGQTVRTARIALGGVATIPWRAHFAEAVLAGKPLTEANARDCARAEFAHAVAHGDNAYKIELGERTVVRALMQAAAMKV